MKKYKNNFELEQHQKKTEIKKNALIKYFNFLVNIFPTRQSLIDSLTNAMMAPMLCICKSIGP